MEETPERRRVERTQVRLVNTDLQVTPITDESEESEHRLTEMRINTYKLQSAQQGCY